MNERSLLDEIRERGVLRIAVEFNPPPQEDGFPPEFYIDPETGEPAGIAPTIGGLIAQDLGVKLECVDLPWPEHVPALVSGKVDLLPKHTNTPKRALQIEFATGRLHAYRVTALLPAASAITNKSELNREGTVITVWHGSSIRDIIRKEFPRTTVREHKKPSEEVERKYSLDPVVTGPEK